MARSRIEIFAAVAVHEMTIEEAMEHLARLDEASAEDEADAQFYPLSEGQQALYMHHQIDPNSVVYHVPAGIRIRGSLDQDALLRVLHRMIDRHEVLRTSILFDEGEAFQTTDFAPEFDFAHEQAAGLSEEEILRRYQEDTGHPFDLENGPLMRVRLYTRSTDDHYLLMCFHHIIMDGMSLSLFVQELSASYAGEVRGEPADLPEKAVAYADFVQWQSDMLQSEEGKRSREYWHRLLAGDLPVLDMQRGRPHGGTQTAAGGSDAVEVSEALTAQLESLSLDQGVTLYVTMLAAYQVLLSHCSGRTDILVGTPMAGRPDFRFQDVLGYFTNMVAIRSDLSGDRSFASLLKPLHDQVMDAWEHSQYPYYTLMRELGFEPFQVSFQFQSWTKEIERAHSASGGALWEPLVSLQQENPFDLVLEVYPGGDKLTLFFKYNPNILHADTVKEMARQYVQILQDAV